MQTNNHKGGPNDCDLATLECLFLANLNHFNCNALCNEHVKPGLSRTESLTPKEKETQFCIRAGSSCSKGGDDKEPIKSCAHIITAQCDKCQAVQKIMNMVKRCKPFQEARVEHFKANKIKEKPKQFQELTQRHKHVVTSDCAIPVTGVLWNQMKMLEDEHLKTHPDVIAVLPTKKTDKDPHR